MIPCKFCEPRAGANLALKGLKQTGKTRYMGTRFARRYRCQDCGAPCIMRGDTVLPPGSFADEWHRPQGS